MRLLALLLPLLLIVSGEKKQSKKQSSQKRAESNSGADGDLSNVVESFVDEEDREPLTLTTLSDINNSTSCADLGYADITEFRYAFPLEVKYTLPDGQSDKLFLPVLSTHDLSKKNKNVKKVLFAVHGKEGDVDTYFCLAKYAADQYALRHGKEKDEVAVIAPWFSEEQNTAPDWAGDNAKSSYDDYTSVYWGSSNWISSANDACNASSTFDALDELMETSLNPKVFPHAKRISLVGFSAGGQVVERYAWASSVTKSDADSEVDTIRFIISDPSSHLYLSAERPAPGCIPLYDSGYSTSTDHTYCSIFSSSSRVVPNIDTCSDYDTWKYGVTTFEDTSTYSYLASFAQDDTGDLVESQTKKLRSKDVRFLFGSEDTCNCNSAGYSNPDTDTCYPTDSDGNALSCSPNTIDSNGCCDTYPGSTSNELSTSCGSELQGYNRLQRGLVYMSYLKWLWASHDYTPSYSIINGLSHDAETMYRSDILGTWSFSDDDEQEEIEVEEDVILVSLNGAANPNARGSASSVQSGQHPSSVSAGSAASAAMGPDYIPAWFLLLSVMVGVAIAAYLRLAVKNVNTVSETANVSEKVRLVGTI